MQKSCQAYLHNPWRNINHVSLFTRQEGADDRLEMSQNFQKISTF